MSTHFNRIINKNDKHIDEQKSLGKCAYIQNVEYNEQITQPSRELNKRDGQNIQLPKCSQI